MRRPRFKRLLIAAGALVALVAIISVALWLALSTASVQQAVVARISTVTEERLGLAFSADSLRVRPLSGRLEALAPRLGTAETPFIAAERLSARVRPLSLLSGRPRIESLELVRPVVDLERAPPPADDDTGTDAPLEELPLVIDQLRIVDGSVRGRVERGAFHLERLELAAGFDGRRLEIRELLGGVRLEPAGGEAVEVELAARGETGLDGRTELAELRLSGTGLYLEATGSFSPRLEENRGEFSLKLDPGALLHGTPSGPIVASGAADLDAWEGEVRLDTASQPAAPLGELLPPELAEKLELGSTRLDLAARLELADERAVTGEVRLEVVREEQVATLDLEPRLLLIEGLPATAAVELSLLPDSAGQRRARATLTAERAASLDTWRIDTGEVRLEEPRAELLARRIAALYPGLLDPQSLAAVPALGLLSGGGEVAGAALDPQVDFAFELRPPGGGRISLYAFGSAVSGPLRLESAGAEVALAGFTEAVTGRVDWRAAATLPDLEGIEFEAAAHDLATADAPLVDELRLTLSGNLERLAWRLDTLPAGGGRVTATGGVTPELPLASLSADFDWETGDERAPRIVGDLELAGGVLAADIEAPLEERGTLTLTARMPLASLAALPPLAALADAPLMSRGGPIVASWNAPRAEWSGLLLPASVRERLEELTFGSSGNLVFDPGCPACAEVEATLDSPAIAAAGRRAEAPEGLVFRLSDGRLRIEPFLLTGDGLRLNAAGELELDRAWRLGDDLARLAGGVDGEIEGELESAWLETLPVEIIAPGTVALAGTLSGSAAAPVAALHFSAPELRLAATARPDLVFGDAAARVSLSEGVVEWETARLSVGSALLTGRGRAVLAAPLADASGVLEVESGMPVVEGLELPFTLRDGVLEIAGGEVATETGRGSLDLRAAVDGRDGSEIEVRWNLPALDWSPLLDRLGLADAPQTLEFATRGDLALVPDQPAASRGNVVFEALRAVARDRESVIEPGVRIELAAGELMVSPFVLTSRDESFTLRAGGRLDPAWRLGDAPASLLGDLRLDGDGRLSAALLDPFLAGGRAEGALGLEIAFAGPSLDALTGSVILDGDAATLLYRSPYLTRIERPQARLSIRNGRVMIDEASGVLNEGSLQVSGVAYDGGAIDLSVAAQDAYFRLDYGLVATLGADLRYRGAGDGTAELSGRIAVERGSLTRDLRLDLGFLSQLLAPLDLTTTEDDPLELVALDLEVSTREGVRVKNNLGDMLARWEPLRVTGSLALPVIEGSIEVDPGGLLYAYGQTVRLDKAVIEYPGRAGVDPRLDLEVTTSLEDPTIGQLSGADPFQEDNGADDSGVGAAAVTADLATYYGDQIAERVGESVGFRLSLRPLLIFGEADPGARLTIGRDLSPQLAVAASVDLREAEGQTYLVELHELPQLPRLVAQAFTNDQSAYGAALLQRQTFGGTKAAKDEELPRISKLVFEPPPGVSRRGVKRALELEKGDRFDERQRFVSEVALVDYLAGRGYPAARVALRAAPDGRRGGRVRLEVTIRPGPRVRFSFEGDKPSQPAQDLIVSLYRPDFFEAESVEEVRAETVRALRSRGFLEPAVEVEVETSGEPGAERRVVVRAEGGTRISPEPPIFTGVPGEVAEALAAVFANAVKRVELAVGLPSADRLLHRALADQGYPEGQILNRYQSLKERVLTVEIDPGPRREVTAVEIRGAELVPEVTASELLSLVTVRTGEALERPELSRSALALERRLSSLGYLDARVRTEVVEAEADPYSPSVRFEIEPGARARLAELEISGLRSTRESWARNVIDLEAGRPLGRGDLGAARTRLWRTGLFTAVAAESFEIDSEARRVVFELEESPRYRLAYGIRWDSDEGEGAVVDVTDSNFLGRAWTLGLRAFYSDRERSLRGLTRIPRVFGGEGSLELFAALREERETVFDVIFGSSEAIEDIRELTLQYSHPVGRHTTLRAYGRYRETVRQLPFITDEFKNPLIGLQYLFNSRVPLPLSERGMFASIDLSGSDTALGGDLTYLRLFSQLSYFQPLGGESLNWSQSVRIGVADAFDQLLVRDVRFFAGGEYSVRGYTAESLGPQRRFGSIVEPAGGAALLILNQELRWRAFDDIALVLFGDAGDVYEDVDDLGSSFRSSLGLGVRYESPVGLLRLDLAHALDRRRGIDPEFKLYFGLGTAF